MVDYLNASPIEWSGIACALLAGAIIGLERQLLGKPVGIRTSALICLATYLFVSLSLAVSVTANVSDPTRVIGQVVTGVGFLGAGVIIARHGVVLGVTSAAVIWVLAAIGSMIGVGYYFQGVALAVLTVAVLVGLDKLEHGFKSLQKNVDEKFEPKDSNRAEEKDSKLKNQDL